MPASPSANVVRIPCGRNANGQSIIHGSASACRGPERYCRISRVSSEPYPTSARMEASTARERYPALSCTLNEPRRCPSRGGRHSVTGSTRMYLPGANACARRAAVPDTGTSLSERKCSSLSTRRCASNRLYSCGRRAVSGLARRIGAARRAVPVDPGSVLASTRP